MTLQAIEAAKIIKARCNDFKPKVAIALGSGSAGFAEQIKNKMEIPYSELPGFPHIGVKGHESKVILGQIKGVNVACLKGRAHYYEGFTNSEVQTMIRTLRALGTDIWFGTNASGSLHKNIGPGSLVVLKDHINFQFCNALVGPNEGGFGERFVALDEAYDKSFRQQLLDHADQLDIPIHEGVYVGVIGPAFETPAEINAFRILGGDLVGMSTVPEVTIARHCGMRVAVVAIITNFAAGMHSEALSHEVTLKGAKLGEANMTKLALRFIEKLPK